MEQFGIGKIPEYSPKTSNPNTVFPSKKGFPLNIASLVMIGKDNLKL